MTRRKRLYDIADLKIAGLLEQKSDFDLNEYWDKLNSFTEEFPELEEKLRACFKSMNGLYTVITLYHMIHDTHKICYRLE